MRRLWAPGFQTPWGTKACLCRLLSFTVWQSRVPTSSHYRGASAVLSGVDGFNTEQGGRCCWSISSIALHDKHCMAATPVPCTLFSWFHTETRKWLYLFLPEGFLMAENNRTDPRCISTLDLTSICSKWWHWDLTFRVLQCVSTPGSILPQNVTMNSKMTQDCALTVIAFSISPVVPEVGVLFKVLPNASGSKTSALKLRSQHELSTH